MDSYSFIIMSVRCSNSLKYWKEMHWLAFVGFFFFFLEYWRGLGRKHHLAHNGQSCICGKSKVLCFVSASTSGENVKALIFLKGSTIQQLKVLQGGELGILDCSWLCHSGTT